MSHISQVAFRSPSEDRNDGAGKGRPGAEADFAPTARDKEKRELVAGAWVWKMEGS
jgi:hypothetical protein